ncbi:inovirus-type Gp2 protein [Pseudomonas moraviensis]|uniref:YagK/YfjJ domain-containing protein n=1 Tax=Pseudomonas moraviensis TaxID=321662 RepID=UPI0018D931E2|nr:inovirus-type Gp2 protein [Pseudomonas moraviensis]MBH3442232.1 inovirus-type Gp2 protein [Pseudomonas moraviensis]
MKMKTSFDDTFRGMKVNANKNKGYGVYPVILDRMLDQITNLQEYHSRVTVVRLDLHFPEGHGTNNKLENTMLSRYIKRCKADLGSSTWGAHKRLVHGWVKEVGESSKSHYHLFFAFQTLQLNLGLLSGAGHTGVWKLLEDRWSELTGGTVHFSKQHRLTRDNPEAFAKCFYHLSYLAKVRDKHFGTGDPHRRFGFRSYHLKLKIKNQQFWIS